MIGKTVYVLMEADWGGTFSSHLYPTGKAVTDKEAAEEWVKKGDPWSRASIPVTIIEAEDLK